jgi:hypothetical protein
MTADEAHVGARVAMFLEPGEKDNGWRATIADPTDRYAAESDWAHTWTSWTRHSAVLVRTDDGEETWADLEDLRLIPATPSSEAT